MTEGRSCDRDALQAAFMANVSHDLKSPLNVLVGYSSVLLQSVEGLDQDRQRYLRMVSRSAEQLLERIDALTLFFRLRAGTVDLRPEWLTPGQLLLQIAEPFRESIAQKGIELVVESGTSLRIRSSARLLSVILRELVSNAVKFTQKDRIELGVAAADGGCVFTVADSGGDLNPRVLQELTASLQGDGYEGLGLGLALAREAARPLGGGIHLRSNPGRGSTFTLLLALPPDCVSRQ